MSTYNFHNEILKQSRFGHPGLRYPDLLGVQDWFVYLCVNCRGEHNILNKRECKIVCRGKCIEKLLWRIINFWSIPIRHWKSTGKLLLLCIVYITFKGAHNCIHQIYLTPNCFSQYFLFKYDPYWSKFHPFLSKISDLITHVVW